MNNEISNNFIKLWWRSTDRQIIISFIILFAFSLMLVTTSGSAVASRIGLEESYFASRQIFYLAAASGLILLFSCLNKKWLRRFAIVGFIASIVLLIAVKFGGYEVKGAVRWINILGLSIQPSEFIKPFFAVVTGWILSLKFNDDFPSFTICVILYSIVAILFNYSAGFWNACNDYGSFRYSTVYCGYADILDCFSRFFRNDRSNYCLFLVTARNAKN